MTSWQVMLMEMMPDSPLPYVLWLPLLSAVAVVISGRWPNVREGLSLLFGIALFLVVLSIALTTHSWDDGPRWLLAEPLFGFTMALKAEPLGILFALIASFLWPVTTLYSVGYMRAQGEKHQTRFYAAFAVSIGAAMGIAFAADMLTLFLFYELITLATYPLVTHSGTDEAKRAGRLYLGVLMGTSILLMMLAMALSWEITGTLKFTPGGIFTTAFEQGHISETTLSLLLVFFVLGTGKAALMPFHRWLPAAMVAPTPVSALLHAVAVVKAGVFTVLKIAIYLFGLDLLSQLTVTDWLAYLAGLTILLASIVAMRCDNLKQRLAYSTISQLGYIVMGAMLAVSVGVVGSSMHMVTHAFGKITLFFCAGAILVAAHKTCVSELNGLGRRMPLTMLAFLIGALSIAGLPPMGGTWSKWMLLQGTLDAQAWGLMLILIFSAFLNLIYLVSVPVRAFIPIAAPNGIHNPNSTFSNSSNPPIAEAPMMILVAIGITAVGSVTLFFQIDWLLQMAEKIIAVARFY